MIRQRKNLKGVSMKDIGVKKEIDKLGRLQIPKEIRELYHLEGEVALINTVEGLLIKKPQYILVKIENESKE